MSITLEDVQGAVARGWCAEPNIAKVMDAELATEIADEVYKLYPPDEDAAAKDLVWSVMDEGQRADVRRMVERLSR